MGLFRDNIDCKTVRIFAYSSTREQSNKRSGTRRACEARALRARKTNVTLYWFLYWFWGKKRPFCSLDIIKQIISVGHNTVKKSQLVGGEGEPGGYFTSSRILTWHYRENNPASGQGRTWPRGLRIKSLSLFSQRFWKDSLNEIPTLFYLL